MQMALLISLVCLMVFNFGTPAPLDSQFESKPIEIPIAETPDETSINTNDGNLTSDMELRFRSGQLFPFPAVEKFGGFLSLITGRVREATGLDTAGPEAIAKIISDGIGPMTNSQVGPMSIDQSGPMPISQLGFMPIGRRGRSLGKREAINVDAELSFTNSSTPLVSETVGENSISEIKSEGGGGGNLTSDMELSFRSGQFFPLPVVGQIGGFLSRITGRLREATGLDNQSPDAIVKILSDGLGPMTNSKSGPMPINQLGPMPMNQLGPMSINQFGVMPISELGAMPIGRAMPMSRMRRRLGRRGTINIDAEFGFRNSSSPLDVETLGDESISEVKSADVEGGNLTSAMELSYRHGLLGFPMLGGGGIGGFISGIGERVRDAIGGVIQPPALGRIISDGLTSITGGFVRTNPGGSKSQSDGLTAIAGGFLQAVPGGSNSQSDGMTSIGRGFLQTEAGGSNSDGMTSIGRSFLQTEAGGSNSDGKERLMVHVSKGRIPINRPIWPHLGRENIESRDTPKWPYTQGERYINKLPVPDDDQVAYVVQRNQKRRDVTSFQVPQYSSQMANSKKRQVAGVESDDDFRVKGHEQ